MKYIVFIILGLLVSCSNKISDPPPFRDAPTQFVITDILDREGMENMTTYYVEVIDANNLVKDKCNNVNQNLMFWFCDSANKYKLGQPIRFDKLK